MVYYSFLGVLLGRSLVFYDGLMFERIIHIILRNEGGLSDHPNDPGGLTNFGIAQKFYPDLDIKNLTKEQAIEIYRRDYWNPMTLEGIKNPELVLQIFDMGVNAGIRTAIKIIQRIVLTDEDGDCGPITTGLINRSSADLVDLYKSERKKYYCSLVRKNPSLAVFMDGWFNRVDKTKL